MKSGVLREFVRAQKKRFSFRRPKDGQKISNNPSGDTEFAFAQNAKMSAPTPKPQFAQNDKLREFDRPLVANGKLHPPGFLAEELLKWVTETDQRQNLRFPELVEIYERLCHRRGWVIRPWAPVAREFSKLTTGGKKMYSWYFDNQTLRNRRLRVYPISLSKVADQKSGTEWAHNNSGRSAGPA